MKHFDGVVNTNIIMFSLMIRHFDGVVNTNIIMFFSDDKTLGWSD